MIWVNGERLPNDGRHISALDRGLTLADGAFETMRARHGMVFRLERHLARLARTLRALQMPEPPEIRDWLMAAVRSADLPAAGVRLTVTRGAGPPGVLPPDDAEPTVLVTVDPMPAFPASIYAAGLSAFVVPGRRNEYAMTAGLKTLAFTENVAALLEARRQGTDEALFLDIEGHCSEASASNLFIRADGVLTTPPLSCGVLPGITREAVLELARAGGMPPAERAFTLDDLLRADEAFLTSSLRGLVPLVRVAETPIGGGTPGELTRRLSSAYAELVSREGEA